MRVTRSRGEKSLKELVERLYRIHDEGPTAAEAASALVEANRNLPLRSRTLARSVAEGTLIAVPELGGAFDGRSSSPLTETGARLVATRATEALERVGQGLEEDVRRSADNLERIAGLLDSEEFRAAAAEDPRLAKQFAAVRKNVDTRRARLDAVHAARRQAVADARQRIDDLAATAGGGRTGPR